MLTRVAQCEKKQSKSCPYITLPCSNVDILGSSISSGRVLLFRWPSSENFLKNSPAAKQSAIGGLKGEKPDGRIKCPVCRVIAGISCVRLTFSPEATYSCHVSLLC
jgi:hypothetical protein